MNAIDKIISIFSPVAAYRREKYRAALDILSQRRFDGAARGRRTSNLPVGDSSANTENATQLSLLRARSRHFGRNNSYAKRGFKSIANNVVGTGIMPAPKTKFKGKLNQVKAAWKNWAETTECDFDGRLTFYGIQRLAMRNVAESGEVLIIRRRKSNGTLPIEIQMLEADYLDHTRDILQLPDGGWIIQGIEYDSNGKRRGYWLFKSHPMEAGFRQSRLVPAEDVIHIYELLRPGQARGVPFIHSAMLRINDFDDFEDAELVKQKVAACFAAFVEDADPTAATGGSGDDAQLERLEPGTVEYLAPGKRVAFANPPVHNNYDSYSRSVLRGIAAGMDVTYESMTGDLSNVNFSSGRMGWIEMHRQVEAWQWDVLIPQLCDGVWRWFAEALQMKQGIMAADLTVDWTAPRREMIDPVKETQALNSQVRTGLKTWSEAVREMGFEPEAQLQEIAAWQKQLDELGVTLDSDGRVPQAGGQPQDNTPPEPPAAKTKK